MINTKAPLLCRFGLVLLFGLLVTGCSSIKYYPNTLDKNVLVKVIKLDSGSMFNEAQAHFHIYNIDKQCNQLHLGAVKLDQPEVEIGVVTGKPVVLEVAFGIGGNYFSTTSSTIRVETMLTLRKNYFYDVTAMYDDGIYDVEVIEKKGRKSRGRVLKNIHSNACKAK